MVSVPAVAAAATDAGTASASVPTSARASPAAGSMHAAGPAKSKSGNGVTSGSAAPPPNPLSSMKSAPLDLNSVERRGQPTACKEPPKKKSRPHDLEEAPTYRPTEEEFKDPFEYIRKITPEASQYGICKIIPPASWNPDFAIDTERFHFKTRKQELNSIEGSSRANLSYVDGLLKFHKQQGNPTANRLPYVDKKPLDLFRLKKAVESRGGFDRVCKLKKWAEIGRDLGYSGKIMSSLSTSLKNSYSKWIQPYEEYVLRAKPSVHQQLELEYGGPLTPSPAPSPLKRSTVNTPSSLRAESPAKQASDLLQTTVSGTNSGRDTPVSDAPIAIPPAAGGFTAINSSAFTAVNSSLKGSTSTPEYRPSSLGPAGALKRQLSCDSLDSSAKDAATDKDEADSGSRRSKRLKKDNVPTVAGSHMSLLRPSVPRIPRDETTVPGEKCEQCGKGGEAGGPLLTCDSCDHGYHGTCVEPPQKTKPDGEWNCPRCLVGDGNFGFEEGGLYSLKQFQEKASDFKVGYFENKMPFDPVLNCLRPVTEDDVEREFWRLVADLEETVEVEYGADIHCTTHGSGFPTSERNPDNPYSTDPWNLNILPLHPESLFRYIKSDISGMTVPWVYVGMIFSTFCWHAEDHWAYSANYQHFGATKTWYGIPGEDAEKFEAAMREAVPELFETQPDLLFQLVTLLTPEQLKKAGVRVYALDQRAGQFVITFPRAYHAGFNHGFNFNEAVNFAPRDWEPYGLLGVQTLRHFRRQPCFSHDELLWTAAEGIASAGLTIPTAKWLYPALEKIHQREVAERELFINRHVAHEHKCVFNGSSVRGNEECPLTFTIDDAEVPEEEYGCAYCKAYTFLSRFKCLKSGKVLCLTHAGDHPCCDAREADRYLGKNHVLFYRKADNVIAATLRKVEDKAHLPEAWMERYERLLEEEARPSLKALRGLLADGEKIPYELPQLPNLRRFVERCNHWVEEAMGYVLRKQQNRRKSEKLWPSSSRKSIGHGCHEQKERELRNVSNVYRLLDEAEQIGFDCPEIVQLQERAEAIKTFQANAKKALDQRQAMTAQQVEELLEEGQAFSVDIPEVERLTGLLERLRWDEKARANRGVFMSLDEVNQLIEDGMRLQIPSYNDHMEHYREQLSLGQNWERKAQEVINAETIHFPQLQALSEQAQGRVLPVSADTLAKVDQILAKQREAHRHIVDLNQRLLEPDYRKRPKYAEVSDLVKKLEEIQAKPPGTHELEREQRRHEDWMRKGKKLFGKTNAPLHILKSHMEYVHDRNLDCFNINEDKPRLPAEPASREASPDSSDKTNRWEDARFREVFCICRRVEAGMMIECEVCHEWYHGKCLKIARGKVKEDDKYTCPICDWNVRIPRDATRPKLEDLEAWRDEIPALPFQPEEEEVLSRIIDTATEFRKHIAPLCNPVLSTRSEAETQRFYLRKIEGAEVLLVFEYNFFRQELHKWNPIAARPPPVLEESKSTRKPRPTKLQKMLLQYGVDDPDHLPEEVRGKANSLKRKAIQAEAAAAQQQQAAAAAQAGGTGTGTALSSPHMGSTLTSPGLHNPYGGGGATSAFYSRNSSVQPPTPGLSSVASSSALNARPSHGADSSASSSSHQGGRAEPTTATATATKSGGGGMVDLNASAIHPAFFGGAAQLLVPGGHDDGPQQQMLSLEERLLLRDEDEDVDGAAALGAPLVSRENALDIFARTEHGRQRAEEIYGRDVWDRRKDSGPHPPAGAGAVGVVKAEGVGSEVNDPIGIGAEEGESMDVDRMFGELVNQDEDEESGGGKRLGSLVKEEGDGLGEGDGGEVAALLDAE